MATKARLATLMPIRNMNRALRFYTKSLGGRVQYRGRGAMRDAWAWIRLGDHDVWLIKPERREKHALAYTTFLVQNIRGFVRQLSRKGVKFQKASPMGPKSRVEGPIAFETFGAAAFFKDPEGNLLMIWQNSP